jgi:hypothetical protein
MEEYQDLSTFTVGDELNIPIELDYDKSSYPALDDMLSFIRLNRDEPAAKIDLEALSVNGICVKDKIKDYLNHSGISSAALKETLKSPLAFFVYENMVFPPKEGKHFELGTFAHLAFLEPELFEKVTVAPDGISLATKDGVIRMINFYQKLNGSPLSQFGGEWKMQDLKDYLEKEKADCQYQIIEPEHKIIIDAMRQHYYTYGGGIIPKLMKGALTEVSMYGMDEYGQEIKVRPDAVNIAENIGVNAIISVKTTRAESIGKFTYDCARLKYEVSEGFYQQVVSSITGRTFNVTIMIILQTVPPYQPAVLWWSPDSLEVGKYKANIAASIIAECREKNFYPGFDAKAPAGNCGIYEFELPDWAYKEEYPTAIEEE